MGDDDFDYDDDFDGDEEDAYLDCALRPDGQCGKAGGTPNRTLRCQARADRRL